MKPLDEKPELARNASLAPLDDFAMKIGRFDLTRDVLIVAEIGNNHEGDPALARELVRLAARSGAGAVKFQTIVPERLVSATQPERLRQLERFQLGHDEFERLAKVAAEEGVLFLSTPFDVDSVRFLEPLVPAFKIASGDNDFLPLIEAAARTGKPVLLSTGLATLEEMARMRDHLLGDFPELELAMLHCVSCYPTPPEDANLGAIQELATLVEIVGYSDHTLGIEAATLSVALGARIVEKHFTIDKNRSSFRDHQLSADPSEFAELVRRIREVRLLLGEGVKAPRACEAPVRAAARRSIVAARDLPAGMRISPAEIEFLRPGGGLGAHLEAEILGRKLRRSYRRGEPLRLEDLD